MSEEAAPDDDTGRRPGRFAQAALRAVDAALQLLRRLRERIDPTPAPADDLDEDEAAAATVPGRPTLLHRMLVVLLCLLLGATAGGLLAYRIFAKQLNARNVQFEDLLMEIGESRQAEERSLDAQARYRAEMNDFRKQLREAQAELAASEERAEELRKRLATGQRSDSAPAPRPAPSARLPSSSQRTGICVTRPGDPPEKLQECLARFNRP